MSVVSNRRALGVVLVLAGCCGGELYGQMLYVVEDYQILRTDTANAHTQWVAGKLLDWPNSIVMDRANQVLFWADYDLDAIYCSNFDGSNPHVVHWNFGTKPRDLGIDTVRKKIYWTDVGSLGIRRSNYDGSALESFLEETHAGLNMTSVEVDSAEQKVYWVNHPSRSVRRTNTDGSGSETLVTFSTSSGYAHQLALDLVARKFYVLVRTSSNQRIVRANLDGSNVEDFVSLPSPVFYDVEDLAVDNATGVAYWTYSDSDTVYRSNTDGTGIEEVPGFDYASGIAIDGVNRRLYVGTKWNDPSILRANIEDLVPETLVPNPIRSPSGFLADSHSGKLYFNDTGSDGNSLIRRMNLDGSGIETVFDVGAGGSYALDAAHGKVYWAGVRPDRIGRADLDGANPQILFQNFLDRARGLVVDPVARRFYWADQGDAAIRSARLDGTDVQSVVETEYPLRPIALSLDTVNGKIYWVSDLVNYSDENAVAGESLLLNPGPAVYRADLDGSNVETIGLSSIRRYGVAIDYLNQKVYWSEFHKILRVNFDGSGQEQFQTVPPMVGFPTSLQIDSENGKIYWADLHIGFPLDGKNDSAFARANLDGTQPEVIFNTGDSEPRHFAIDATMGRIFYTVKKDLEKGELWSTDLNGNYPVILAESNDDPYWGVSYDPVEDRIFWTVAGSQRDRIETARSDGSEVATVVQEEYGTIGAIAVDSDANALFWADSEPVPSAIYRSDLDAHDVHSIVSSFEYPIWDLFVHPETQQLFWSEHGVVRRSDYEGFNVIEVSGGVSNSYFSLDQRGHKIYWSENGDIKRTNLDGTDVEDLFLGPSGPLAISASPHIAPAQPLSCAIDARQPHEIDDPAVRFGLASIDLTFSGELLSSDPLDFEVIETGGDGVAPAVQAVEVVGPAVVRVTLVEPIEPGVWTCFYHVNSGTKSCVGYLPGDVDGDGTSSPVDVLRLIDSLNGVANPVLEIWQTDINRSGAAEPSDILRLIDLLNGAGAFEVWNGRTIGACP